jgi:hypothetical protein
MATKKGAAARIWLDDGVYPMWTGFITKGWREVHYNMKIHQIVTTTRKIRRAMEEGRWKMWTARCDNVHRVDDEETISERERTHTKLKKFWVRHVGMKSVGKSIVEVCILHMEREQREVWMTEVKGKEYYTTRVDDHFDVQPDVTRQPREVQSTHGQEKKWWVTTTR